jgi:hypothetical protein
MVLGEVVTFINCPVVLLKILEPESVGKGNEKKFIVPSDDEGLEKL